MNNKFIVAVLMIFCSVCCSLLADTRTGDQSQWPTLEIRPTPQATLKNLFDAGLRPYRFPRLERSLLEQKHLKIIFVQSDGSEVPPFHCELLRIGVQDKGIVSSIVLANAPMRLAEIREEVMRWLPYGQNPVRTEQELNSFLKAVEQDYRGYNYGPNSINHDFRLAWRDDNDINYAVWFQSALNPDTPLAVHMSVRFPITRRQSSNSYDIPIPPPLGYEHVDMSAPKDFGPDSPPEDPEVKRVREAGVMPDYSMLSEKRDRPGTLSSDSQNILIPPPPTANKPQLLSLWIVCLTVAVLMVLFVLLKAIRKHRQ